MAEDAECTLTLGVLPVHSHSATMRRVSLFLRKDDVSTRGVPGSVGFGDEGGDDGHGQHHDACAQGQGSPRPLGEVLDCTEASVQLPLPQGPGS